MQRHFKRDEFLGRINEMLYFLPFSRSELNTLVEKQLEMWKEKVCLSHDTHVMSSCLGNWGHTGDAETLHLSDLGKRGIRRVNRWLQCQVWSSLHQT